MKLNLDASLHKKSSLEQWQLLVAFAAFLIAGGFLGDGAVLMGAAVLVVLGFEIFWHPEKKEKPKAEAKEG